MKFTRPINREVDIAGETFILTFDETGISFRLKGKRKSNHVEWERIRALVEDQEEAIPARSSAASAGESESGGAYDADDSQWDDDAGGSEDLARTITAGDGSSQH